MRKSLVWLSLAAFVATVGAETASAQTPGFFESLFGPRKQRPYKKVAQPEKRLPFWLRKRKNGSFGNDQIRFVRNGYGDEGPKLTRKRKAKPALDYSDPEPIPGLGLGNPVYVPPRVLPLADPAFAKLDATSAKNLQLFAVLADIKSGIRVEEQLRQPILSFYKSNGFSPLWIEQGKPSPRAIKLLELAATVDQHGLEPNDYLPAGLTSFTAIESQLESTPETLARFDVALTAASLRLAQHMSGGRFDPNRLSLYNDLPAQRVSPEIALNVLAHSPFPEAYIAGLAPTNPAYGLMKVELAKLRGGGDVPENTTIAEGNSVKVGGSDPRVLLIRDRLQQLGFIDPEAEIVDAEFAMQLDKDLSVALKSYQKSVGVKASGRLDNATIKKLNANTRGTDMQRLVINMERMRWLPRQMASRHVFVNQPAYEVRVMDKGVEAWRSKVIVGRQMTQTASFYDEMETVVFNPSWGVPQSIIVNEYLGKLRRDPGYFDRIGYKVVNQKGKVVSSRSVNWYSYSQSSPVGVQQPPGASNALGELKFLFPNKHSIYMHDTPTRKLFSQPVRAFSHGCVRVEDPREFARVLLGWDRAKIDAMTESGNSESVKLPEKVPVYLTYFTAWPDSSGKLQYFNDIYERDAAMLRAMAGNQQRQAASISGAIVQN